MSNKIAKKLFTDFPLFIDLQGQSCLVKFDLEIQIQDPHASAPIEPVMIDSVSLYEKYPEFKRMFDKVTSPIVMNMLRKKYDFILGDLEEGAVLLIQRSPHAPYFLISILMLDLQKGMKPKYVFSETSYHFNFDARVTAQSVPTEFTHLVYPESKKPEFYKDLAAPQHCRVMLDTKKNIHFDFSFVPTVKKCAPENILTLKMLFNIGGKTWVFGPDLISLKVTPHANLSNGGVLTTSGWNGLNNFTD